MHSLRYYSIPDVDPEEHDVSLPQIVVQPNGTGHADPAVLFTGPQWGQFAARVAAATSPDPDFDLPVTIRYLGLLFTARRTTDWMTGRNTVTSCSQQSVYYVAFNYRAARRVLGFRTRLFRPFAEVLP